MRVVIIGTDQSLIGGRQLGDAVERHRQYGEGVTSLDVIVYSHRRQQLPGLQISDRVQGWATNSWSKICFPWDAVCLFRNLQRQHPRNIVVCQDPFVTGLVGCWLKWRYRVKLQINFHGDFWDNQAWRVERWWQWPLLWLSRWVVGYADAVRVMSDGQKEKVIAAGIPAERVHVIATPVDLSRFASSISLNDVAALRQTWGVGERPVVLMVGRLDPVKDFTTLFAAMTTVHAQRPDVALVLVGNFESRDQLPAGAVPDALTVVCAGRVSTEQLPVYYAASTLVVLSSRSESFGKVLVEAGAAGKPVVATRTTGAESIVQNGVTGLLVPIGDADALATAVVDIVNHPERAQAMGESARGLMRERYGDNTKKIIALWQQLYETTIHHA